MHGKYREGETERAECISQPLPRAAESVGFDIETTGVGPHDIVTVACVWSPGRQAHCFHDQDPSEVIAMLEAATHIHTYNGMEFDLPRFAKHCRLPMGPWARKTVDPLYAMKHTMGTGACRKLNDVLQANGYQPKSGCGLQAVRFWLEGNRDALLSYCMDDARLTYELCQSEAGIKWGDQWVLNLRKPGLIDAFQR